VDTRFIHNPTNYFAWRRAAVGLESHNRDGFTDMVKGAMRLWTNNNSIGFEPAQPTSEMFFDNPEELEREKAV
jgi:hypothetical protein